MKEVIGGSSDLPRGDVKFIGCWSGECIHGCGSSDKGKEGGGEGDGEIGEEVR